MDERLASLRFKYSGLVDILGQEVFGPYLSNVVVLLKSKEQTFLTY